MKLGAQRVGVWLVLVMALALVLAACGGDDNKGNTGGGQATAGGQATTTGGSTSGAANTAPTADPNAPQSEATINISLNADPPSLDPAASSAFVDRQVHNSIFDKLVDLDPKLEIVPMLATKWDISQDGLNYTFTLRDDVKFHDGTKFDAEVVKFNIERGLKEESPRRNELKSVKTVEVVNPTTVKITLKESFAPFLSVLTDRAGMMVSPKAAKELGENFRTKPVGSGPFKFQERVTGDHITLVRNEDYWRKGFPKAKQVTYKIFTDATTALNNLRSGQVDFTDVLPPVEVAKMQGEQGFRVVNEAGLGYQGMYLNTKKAPFDKPEVRKAVDLLVNREAVVKVVLQGTGTPGHSPFAPSHFAYGESDKYTPPDVAQAQQLLSKAGASNLEFTLKTSTGNTELAQLIQGNLQAAGINMKIEQVEFGTLLEQGEKGQFQALQLGWSGRPDPDLNIYDFIVTGGANNDARYSNPTVDEQLNLARKESDEAKRKAAYDKVMQVLHEEVPYVYIYHQNNVFGMTSKITGFQYVPDGIIRTVGMNKQQ